MPDALPKAPSGYRHARCRQIEWNTTHNHIGHGCGRISTMRNAKKGCRSTIQRVVAHRRQVPIIEFPTPILRYI